MTRVLIAALMWCAVGPLSRLALEAGLEPLQVALGRAVVAGACFAVHAALRGGARPGTRDLPGVLVFAVLGVALLFAMNQLAVRAGGAALATVLLYTAPVWVTAAAPVLGERWRAGPVLAAVAAAAGIALLAAGGDGILRPTPAAIAWGLGSGAAYALYSAVGKRLLRRSSPQVLFALALPIAAVALMALGARPSAPAGRQVLPVLAIGVLSYGASLAYGQGLRTLPAARAALLATVEPIGASILAGVLFGERFGALASAGAVLALGAIVLPELWPTGADAIRQQ